jgi:GAF domain-containing protein
MAGKQATAKVSKVVQLLNALSRRNSADDSSSHRKFRIAFNKFHLHFGRLAVLPKAGSKLHSIAERASIGTLAALDRTRNAQVTKSLPTGLCMPEFRLVFSARLRSGWRPTLIANQGLLLGKKERNTMTPAHEELLREFQEFAKTAPTAKSVMERISQRLHEKMARYNWVGFYLVDAADPGILVVGPFVGSFTPNARIPLDTGLCGAAATTKQTVLVADVTKDPRYLAGSSMVNSEIVVPILVGNKLAGELDIESYFANTFDKAEQEFAEACAKVVSKYLAKG